MKQTFIKQLYIFFIVIEFSLKPSRDSTLEPHDPDLVRDLRLVTTHVEEAKSKLRRTHSIIAGYKSGLWAITMGRNKIGCLVLYSMDQRNKHFLH
jgi:hypothetical protein